MRLRPRSTHSHTHAHGFSLVELSIVVAIIGVVSVLGLEAAANFVNRTNGAVTKERLAVLDEAVVKFFKIYGRLPCPADRSLAPSSTSYGLEDCTIPAVTASTLPIAGSNAGGGIMFGAVPFRALNIPMNLSVDGFGSKINYVVTKNLTIAGGTTSAAPTSGRFGTFDSNITALPCTPTDCTLGNAAAANALRQNIGIGGIEIRSGILKETCDTGATQCQKIADPSFSVNTLPNGATYVLFSNGMDRKGGISMRGDVLAPCVSGASTTDGFKVDAQNCANADVTDIYTSVSTPANANVVGTIPLNVFYDTRFNTGFLAKNYFDDYVVWRTKAQL